MSKARTAGITVAVSRELWFQFVALLVCPGCLTHLIVLGFADAFQLAKQIYLRGGKSEQAGHTDIDRYPLDVIAGTN